MIILKQKYQNYPLPYKIKDNRTYDNMVTCGTNMTHTFDFLNCRM